MKYCIIGAFIMLASCGIGDTPPLIAMSRFCTGDSSMLNIGLINAENHSTKVIFTIYADVDSDKKINARVDQLIYKSPITTLRAHQDTITDVIYVDPPWKKYTLIAELEASNGTSSMDKVHPCGYTK